MKLRLSVACVAASALLAGCGGGGSNGIPPISSVNPISTGSLVFAVGTANLYGTGTGLNVVSTYRQASGLSNVTVDTPTITGPFKVPAAGKAGSGVDAYSTLPNGPSAQEVTLGGIITGTSQSVHPGTPACDQSTPCIVNNANGGTTTIPPNTTTFGQSGGVFVNGLSPGNYTNNGVASSYTPYVEPLYDTTSGNQFTPFGGPPAFPGANGLGLRDGLSNIGTGVVGIPLGISTFSGVKVNGGNYTLSLQVPTGYAGQTPTYGTATATATLRTAATLPTITAPAFVLDGKGGGTVTVAALPAGVTEEVVQIVDTGNGGTNCQGATGANAIPVYYTIVAHAAGAVPLPDSIGPNTNLSGGQSNITPSPSICTAAQNTAAAGSAQPGDNYTVQAIGADYPLFESLYPVNTNQTPTLAGANGQADITISAVVGATSASRNRHVSRGSRSI
jgi:hypothetical protein